MFGKSKIEQNVLKSEFSWQKIGACVIMVLRVDAFLEVKKWQQNW